MALFYSFMVDMIKLVFYWAGTIGYKLWMTFGMEFPKCLEISVEVFNFLMGVAEPHLMLPEI